MPDALSYRLEADDGSALGVAGGRIADPEARYGLTVPVGPGGLRPGLINAHDHLHRNHYPRLGAPPYPDAYAWGDDIHDRWADEIARARAVPRHDVLLFGALKNLLGGATTVVHHDRWEADFDDGFPVRVARVRTVHSLGLEPGLEGARDGDPRLPLCIHLAEGTTPDDAAEVRALEARGLLDPGLLAVHAVGVDEDGIARLRAAGAAVVWCPTSNHFLFGRTAPRGLLASGIDVLLGSDSLLTGAGTILDELRAAREFGLLGDSRLTDAVGETAARRLRVEPPSVEIGAPADIVLLRRPLLEARAEDVGLVVVGGVPRLGDERFAPLFERAGMAVGEIRVGTTTKLVEASLAAIAERMIEAGPETARIFADPRGLPGDGRSTPSTAVGRRRS